MSHIAADRLARKVRRSGLTARNVLGTLLAVGYLLAPTGARGQGLEKAVLDRVKDATVYVKIKVNGRPYSVGSGFAIKQLGDTTLILTNRHVAVADEDDEQRTHKAKREIFVVFRSQTAQEQEVPAKLLTFDHRSAPDLAMLEVKGVRNPPAEILADKPAKESDFYETMPAYSLGFPASAGLVDAKDFNFNPAVTVNAISISAFRRNEAGRLERIQYAGSAIGGNSGGPVVNDKGLLVGVVVERIPGENVGRMIPPNVVTGFLAGNVDVGFGLVLSSSGNSSRIALGARMVDPMGKIGSMSMRYILQSAVAAPPKVDNQGHYPLLANAKEVPMELIPGDQVEKRIKGLPVADAVGVVQLDIPITAPSDRRLYIQFVVKDRLGRVYGGEPHKISIPEKPGPIKEMEPLPEAKELAQWSCEVNVTDGVKMKHEPGLTTINLPGGIAMNNSPRLGLFNAPCALVKVDGDFVAQVEILDSFDPGSEGAMLPSGKKYPNSFQSTGILIWQDEKNFVRLERSKESDGRISVLSRVLVEVYKNGREAAAHYIDVPEIPIVLAAVRKGGSIQLLFAMPPKQLAVFHEMAVDFNNEVFVGVAGVNLSKRPFQAKLKDFHLLTLEKMPIVAKPFKMTKLVDLGIERLADGTIVIEGAAIRAAGNEAARVAAQTEMSQFKGEWTGDRQLLWNNDKAARALPLELPVETAGKYEIKARFTYAPDYAIAKLDIDGKPLYKDQKIDFYSQEVRPSPLISLGTMTLAKGKRKLNVTVYNKNPKSSGYHFGLDEIQLVPAK